MKAQLRKYERLAGKYRGLAGQLGFVDAPRIEDEQARASVQAAHDALCRAFTRLEELAGV